MTKPSTVSVFKVWQPLACKLHVDGGRCVHLALNDTHCDVGTLFLGARRISGYPVGPRDLEHARVGWQELIPVQTSALHCDKDVDTVYDSGLFFG